MSSLKPKWSLANAADGATSSTLSEMAEAVIFTTQSSRAPRKRLRAVAPAPTSVPRARR
jgi:hypothetical protein